MTDSYGVISLPKTTTVTQTEETSISPTNASFDSSGGTGSVSVTASSGYSWSATTNSSWITIASGASGVGNGTVNYAVSSNPGESARTGTMTIAGNTFTVNQSGASGSGLWSGATDLGNGWKYLDWFGYFWADETSPWIYHYVHGLAYAYGQSTSDIWFYTTDLDWFWTSEPFYPWIYVLKSGVWTWDVWE